MTASDQGYVYTLRFTSPPGGRGRGTAPPPKPAPEHPASPPKPATLSPDQLAAYLGCGRSHAYEILRRGEIPSFRIGRLRKVLVSDADEYLRRLKAQSEEGGE